MRRISLGAGALTLLALVAIFAYGWTIPAVWSTGAFSGGVLQPSGAIVEPPFPPLTTAAVFDIGVHTVGVHRYLLGSDPLGRDVLGLIARGSAPSALLVAAVVAGRLLLGTVAGLVAGFGVRGAAPVARAAGSWIAGFPYLALAVLVVEAFGGAESPAATGGGLLIAPPGRFAAFVAAMALVGWRDVAELVAERVEHVRAQPFALGARALGSEGLRFYRTHVLPYVSPALAVELPFQASGTLVLLAELAFLQVFLGGAYQISQQGAGLGNVTTNVVALQPELGQLLGDARRYVLYNQLWLALAPALAIALAALGFELIGTAFRGRRRWRA